MNSTFLQFYQIKNRIEKQIHFQMIFPRHPGLITRAVAKHGQNCRTSQGDSLAGGCVRPADDIIPVRTTTFGSMDQKDGMTFLKSSAAAGSRPQTRTI